MRVFSSLLVIRIYANLISRLFLEESQILRDLKHIINLIFNLRIKMYSPHPQLYTPITMARTLYLSMPMLLPSLHLAFSDPARFVRYHQEDDKDIVEYYLVQRSFESVERAWLDKFVARVSRRGILTLGWWWDNGREVRLGLQHLRGTFPRFCKLDHGCSCNWEVDDLRMSG